MNEWFEGSSMAVDLAKNKIKLPLSTGNQEKARKIQSIFLGGVNSVRFFKGATKQG